MSLATSDFLDRSPSTLATALREMVKGEVFSDPYTRSLYATDGSIYEIEPMVVVHPLDELDVRSCLWFGQRHGVPVIARGAGSGTAGESLGKAIVMDLSANMNGILELDKGRKQVTVQAGVVMDSLNRALRGHGLRVAIDPSNSNRSTIGGMIARNASGAHSLQYGDMRKNLIAARVCLMDGTVTLANPTKLSSTDYESKKKEEGLSGKIHRELPEVLKKNAALIESKRPKAERNGSGYLLHDALNGDVYDLAKLICGSEGTLGVVTQAVLGVHPLPERTGVCEIYFATLADALKALSVARGTTPYACEVLDEKLLKLAAAGIPAAQQPPAEAKALLVVEYEGQTEADVAERLAALETKLKDVARISARQIVEAEQVAAAADARATAVRQIYRRQDGLLPTPVVDDAAVPLDKIAAYAEKCAKVFEKYKLEWVAYAHAGNGDLHLYPMMDLKKKEHVDILEKVAGEIHAVVWECGGTISGGRADGLARSQWLEKQSGKEMYAVYKEVKKLFDPSGLLNPEKKITADAHLMLKNLRFGTNYQFSTGERPKASSIDPEQAANFRMFKSQTSVRTENTVEGFASNPLDVHNHGVSLLNWHGAEMAREVEACNGCGYCRTTGPEEDMCPRFKYERVEDASPRAKANLLRRMMTGRQRDGSFSAPELKEIVDTCFNCKLCHDGCPAQVNIPKLVLEAKARHYQSHSLPRHVQVLCRAEEIQRAARWMAPLYNLLTGLLPFRFLGSFLTGLDYRRPISKSRPFRLRRHYMPSVGSDRPKVALYLDLYAKYNGPEIVQAAIDVLEHHGYEVDIPEAPWCKSPALSEGAVAESRETATAVAAALAPFAFQGVPIVTLDASACLALREEFLQYVDTPETRAVARHTYEIGQFLLELKNQNKLKPPTASVNITLGYHQACSQRALHIGTPGLELVRAIAGVKVVQLNHGCCGNPSFWGHAKKNYEESMWIGKGLFEQLADARKGIEYGLSESTCCKLQMEHGAKKRTLHPIQILALSYGYEKVEFDDEDNEQTPPPPANHEEHAPGHDSPAPAHEIHDDHHGAPSVATPTPSMSAHASHDEHAHSH
jgi:FAD/FMN-containing dehydrogenase/Fe-S oxidoreductase